MPYLIAILATYATWWKLASLFNREPACACGGVIVDAEDSLRQCRRCLQRYRGTRPWPSVGALSTAEVEQLHAMDDDYWQGA